MMSLYYRDADVALVCFDLGSAKTFESVDYWIKEIDKNCSQDRVIALAGNKSDLDDARKQVSLSTASEYAKENGISIYHETSAKTGEGVTDIFEQIVSEVIKCKRRQMLNNS